MEVLLVNAQGYEEIVTDFTDFQRSIEANLASWQLTFNIAKTPYNAFAFNLLQSDQASLILDGQTYIVQQINPAVSGALNTVSVTAIHIYFDIQRRIRLTSVMDADYEDDSKPSHTLNEYLQFVFSGDTEGYSYEIQGSFTQSLLISDFGNSDGLSLINQLIDSFSCYVRADNRHVIFMDEAHFKNVTQNQFRSLYNTDNINLQIDRTSVRTKCWVYPYQDEYGNYFFDPYIYVSLNDSQYNGGFGDPVDLSGDASATDKSYTDAQASAALQDVPAVTFSLDYHGEGVPGLGDVWMAVFDTISLDTDVTIVGVTDDPFDPTQAPGMTFSNAKQDMLSLQLGFSRGNIRALSLAKAANESAANLSVTQILTGAKVGEVDD